MGKEQNSINQIMKFKIRKNVFSKIKIQTLKPQYLSETKYSFENEMYRKVTQWKVSHNFLIKHLFINEHCH